MQREKQEQYLHNMIVEVDRLEKGVTNLLTAAGLRATDRSLRPEPADLADDVREVIRAVQERGIAAGIAIQSTNLDASQVERDPEAMRLVLHNLLDNALKYSRKGDRVDVELKNTGDEALLSVTDTGRGMSSEELNSAFDPFYRGPDNTAGGTGLGLHLVKELVEAHGGRVEASSEGPDCGSVLLVRLPIRNST